MWRRISQCILVALLTGGTCSFGAELDCFQRLVLPRYNHMAWQAQIEGEVSVVVGIGKKIDIKASHPLLALLVREAMEASTQASCAHSAVTLHFRFSMQDPRLDIPMQSIEFEKPNRFFVIVTRPSIVTKIFER